MTTIAPPTFDDLYIQYSRAIYERVLYLVRDASRAEDLTQETFIKVWRFLPRLQHTNNLFAWLATIATHTVIDAERERARHERKAYFVSLDSEDAPEIADDQADPETWHLERELDITALVLERLRPEHRRALLSIVNREPVAGAGDKDRRLRARKTARMVYREVQRERMVV